ncbi:MAG TPA: DUF389 domain-containing protein [Synechococcales cyanobacterium M55_K2018_004]|nr:DUF389 domain-containing protein [Synechococcales cyanobacterium M55_K2018_004]
MQKLYERFQSRRYRENGLLEVSQLQAELIEESALNFPFLVLIVSSCAIATFGLLANSTAVIIGAMIIAPLMMPIRGLAFGALKGHPYLFRQGLISLFVGTVVALAIAWVLGRVVGLSNFGSEVMARSEPTLLDLGVAVAAGGISAYAKFQPKIAGSLAGTAIAVALMPPICVIGLGLSQANWSLSWGATLLYLTNLFGIALSCMLVFLLAGYAPYHRARKALLWTLAFTSALVIPLGFSLARLVEQAQLELKIDEALRNRTTTFQRIELVDTTVNWLQNPPEVRLYVRAKEPITPYQVALLEQFLTREMGRPFELIFVVGQVEEIRSSDLEAEG